MRRDVLDIIRAFAHHEAALAGQEFVAPLLRSGRVRLRPRSLVYELTVVGAHPGWWRCRMIDARRAMLLDEALPWQRGDYLALWPQLRLVLLEPRRDSDWLALPYNPSDALQRFDMSGPLVVRLVEGGQPFERVIGRVEGQTIWYDEPDHRASPATAEALRAALGERRSRPSTPSLGPGEQAAFALLSGKHTEKQIDARLRKALAIGGAQLIGYETSGDLLRVTWEHNGRRSVTLISPELSVMSAGICLSGQDRRFDLASIVSVVSEAPAFARYEDDE